MFVNVYTHKTNNYRHLYDTFQGGDLDVKIHECKKKGQVIPEYQVVEWLIQLLLAVQYMHDRLVNKTNLTTFIE